MRNNIKFSASLFAVVLSLILGSVVYAQESSKSNNEGEDKVEVENKLEVEVENEAEDKVETNSEGKEGIRSEFQKEIKVQKEGLKSDIKDNKEENKIKRDEFRDEVKGEKDGLKTEREENKTELQSMIEGVKIKREEFKKEMELNKEALKLKIETAREEFKTNLAKIKDEKKKAAVESIVTNVADLNTKLTSDLSTKIDQIEAVLISIQSRILKAEANGVNVILAKAQVIKAQEDIAKAREAISIQSGKVYTSTLSDETKLKAEMQIIRDTFKIDIKAVFAKVKAAHVSVKNIATTLAQTPKIDDGDSKTETEVETTTDIKVETTN